MLQALVGALAQDLIQEGIDVGFRPLFERPPAVPERAGNPGSSRSTAAKTASFGTLSSGRRSASESSAREHWKRTSKRGSSRPAPGVRGPQAVNRCMRVFLERGVLRRRRVGIGEMVHHNPVMGSDFAVALYAPRHGPRPRPEGADLIGKYRRERVDAFGRGNDARAVPDRSSRIVSSVSSVSRAQRPRFPLALPIAHRGRHEQGSGHCGWGENPRCRASRIQRRGPQASPAQASNRTHRDEAKSRRRPPPAPAPFPGVPT